MTLATEAQKKIAREWVEKAVDDLEYVPPEGRAQRVRMLLFQALDRGFTFGCEAMAAQIGKVRP
jgi:hypothetical protein